MSVKKVNTILQAAVKSLKESGAIRYDSDIARDLNHSKGNISSYLSGKIAPSEKFLNQFYNFYKIQPSELNTSIEVNLRSIENSDNCQYIIDRLKLDVDNLKALLEEKNRTITEKESTIQALLLVVDSVRSTDAKPILAQTKKHT